MKEFTHTNPDFCDPPGAFSEILAHPFYKGEKAIEQATFKEHRFAFFYWYKWWKNLVSKENIEEPPTLITLDYHRDLFSPNDREKKELLEVEKLNEADRAYFCWARMNPQNDGHILSAAYLNVIGNIILLKHQEGLEDNNKLSFEDYKGNKHEIFEFTCVKDFADFILGYETNHIFLDIDLDYFISETGDYWSSEGYIPMNESEISGIINPSSEYFKKIYKHLEGITIAKEPKHCGGNVNSCHILQAVEKSMFTEGKKWR